MSPGEVRESSLLERDDQLALIAEAAGAVAAGEGRLVAVVGDAGLGKSSLLDAVADAARGERMQTLRARGAELEEQHPAAASGPARADDDEVLWP